MTQGTMYRSVLVPLDGSASAEFAMPIAQGIARRTNGRVHLVHVHVPLSAAVARATAVPFYGDWDVEAKQYEAEYLSRLRQHLASVSNVRMQQWLEEGSVVETLMRCTEEVRADLVVMTTHGRGPLARAWLGSVADGMARGARVPVLLLRPTVDPEPMGERLFRNILLTLDGAPLAEQVLEHAIGLGTLAGASYTLVRVVSPMVVAGYAPTPDGMLTDAAYGTELNALIHDAEIYLDRVAARLRARGLTVETQVVAETQPAVGILDYARETAADLIAYGHARAHGSESAGAGQRGRQGAARHDGADPALPATGGVVVAKTGRAAGVVAFLRPIPMPARCGPLPA